MLLLSNSSELTRSCGYRARFALSRKERGFLLTSMPDNTRFCTLYFCLFTFTLDSSIFRPYYFIFESKKCQAKWMSSSTFHTKMSAFNFVFKKEPEHSIVNIFLLDTNYYYYLKRLFNSDKTNVKCCIFVFSHFMLFLLCEWKRLNSRVTRFFSFWTK